TERLLGYSPEEIIGRRFSDFVHPDDLRPYQETMNKARMHPGTVALVEVRARNSSGTWTYMEAVCDNRLGDAAVNGIVLNIRDNSHHRQFMEAFRQQNEYMAVMHETALSLMNRLDITELLQTIISRAATLGGTPDGFIYLREPDTDYMFMKVGVGCFGHLSADPVRQGEYFAGKVWAAAQPQMLSDYSHWS